MNDMNEFNVIFTQEIINAGGLVIRVGDREHVLDVSGNVGDVLHIPYMWTVPELIGPK